MEDLIHSNRRVCLLRATSMPTLLTTRLVTYSALEELDPGMDGARRFVLTGIRACLRKFSEDTLKHMLFIRSSRGGQLGGPEMQEGPRRKKRNVFILLSVERGVLQVQHGKLDRRVRPRDEAERQRSSADGCERGKEERSCSPETRLRTARSDTRRHAET
jgi:hypothetical protein